MDISQIFINIAQAATEAAPSAEPGILGTLGLNWKLFLAQLINFAIILFIFWRWVVKPLGKALADRQNKIEQGLKHAQAMAEQRQAFEEQKIAEFKVVRDEAESIIKNATVTAEQIKTQTLSEASNQADKMIEQTKATLAAEKVQMVREVKKEIADLVVGATEQILREKIDVQKDKKLIEESIKRVEA